MEKIKKFESDLIGNCNVCYEENNCVKKCNSCVFCMCKECYLTIKSTSCVHCKNQF